MRRIMMTPLRNISRFAPAAAVLALAAMQSARGAVIDVDLMYIGDGSDNSLKVFDATGPTPRPLMGTVVKSQGGL
jgi:hypothetical protein